MMLTCPLPKKHNHTNDCHNIKGQSSCRNCIAFMPIPTTKMQLTLHPLAVWMTNLAINLDLTNAVTPACQVPVTNAASAKTAQLNGQIVPCIILPLVHKRQRILMLCANLPKPPNPVTLICPHDVLLCHHATIVTLTPLITLTTKNVPPNVATLVVILAVVHAVVTVMTMIAAARVPLVLAMWPTLDIMMFALLANHTLIFPTASLPVLQVLPWENV